MPGHLSVVGLVFFWGGHLHGTLPLHVTEPRHPYLSTPITFLIAVTAFLRLDHILFLHGLFLSSTHPRCPAGYFPSEALCAGLKLLPPLGPGNAGSASC